MCLLMEHSIVVWIVYYYNLFFSFSVRPLSWYHPQRPQTKQHSCQRGLWTEGKAHLTFPLPLPFFLLSTSTSVCVALYVCVPIDLKYIIPHHTSSFSFSNTPRTILHSPLSLLTNRFWTLVLPEPRTMRWQVTWRRGTGVPRRSCSIGCTMMRRLTCGRSAASWQNCSLGKCSSQELTVSSLSLSLR